VNLREALDAVLAGVTDSPPVREDIGASWRRSVAAGLEPGRVAAPFDADVAAASRFVDAARPVLDQLADDLRDAGVALLLTDGRGHVVDRRVADLTLQAGLDRIQLAPGFAYGEGDLGTNGIGTALTLERPASVEGDEHFADDLTGMSCAAAPIVDPASGQVLGVLDLTAFARADSVLMLPLARRAAREVEQRLVDDEGLSRRLVLQRFLVERRRAKGPMVVVSGATVITNTAAARLVNVDDEPMLCEAALRIAGAAPGTAEALTFELDGGTTVTARSEVILDGHAPVGVVLRLKPVASGSDARPTSRRDRPTFGWTSLTDTERAVMELVAQGLTNRQVGGRLFLSHHTVGFHLRSIYRKLDVSSRVDLARLVASGAPSVPERAVV
jgi:DNA-binding CsgD family transcriptional regulator